MVPETASPRLRPVEEMEEPTPVTALPTVPPAEAMPESMAP